MLKFIVETFIKPFFAILFFLVFGGVFVFFGFRGLEIKGVKNTDNKVIIDTKNSHFFGLLNFKNHIEGVKKANFKCLRAKKRRTSIPQITLSSDSEKIAVSSGEGKIDYKITDKINEFINNPDKTNLNENINIYSVFGWVGLPFFLIGISGLIGWPFSIVKNCVTYLGTKNNSA